jgi:hypothetical protein
LQLFLTFPRLKRRFVTCWNNFDLYLNSKSANMNYPATNFITKSKAIDAKCELIKV